MNQKHTLINKIELYAGLLVIVLLLTRIITGTQLNVLLRISLTLMSIFYMWFGFFIFNRLMFSDLACPRKRGMINTFRTSSSILMGFCYSFCLIAILFSFFFLRGMQVMLGLSSFLLLAGTLLIIAYNWLNKNQTPYLKQFYLRSVVLFIILSLLLIAPVEKRLSVLYADHPDFIEAYNNYRQNPDNEQNIEDLKEARSRFR